MKDGIVNRIIQPNDSKTSLVQSKVNDLNFASDGYT